MGTTRTSCGIPTSPSTAPEDVGLVAASAGRDPRRSRRRRGITATGDSLAEIIDQIEPKLLRQLPMS
jgi:hypothetical protein